MPLNSVQIQAIIKSSIGHLGKDDAQTNLQIRDKVASRLGIEPGADYIATFNYVRQARRMWEQGESIEQSTGFLPLVPTTRDPTLQDSSDNFRYRVVVVIDRGQGDPPERHFTVVDSRVALTRTEIELEAAANVGGADPQYPGRVVDTAVPASGSVTYEILTGGRR